MPDKNCFPFTGFLQQMSR